MVRRQFLNSSVYDKVLTISSSIYDIAVRPDGQRLYVAAGGKILVSFIFVSTPKEPLAYTAN